MDAMPWSKNIDTEIVTRTRHATWNAQIVAQYIVDMAPILYLADDSNPALPCAPYGIFRIIGLQSSANVTATASNVAAIVSTLPHYDRAILYTHGHIEFEADVLKLYPDSSDKLSKLDC
jgi:hypothetical protein